MTRDPRVPHIRVLVVDDHDLICEGLTVLLERQSGIQVVGTAASGTEAVSTALRVRPDIVIMDLMLPNMNGIEATQQISAQLPSTRVIALSASHTPEHIYRVLRAGAHAYVVKDGISSEIVPAIHSVHGGQYYLSPCIDPLILASALSELAHKTPMESLSKREREVLHWIVAGSTSAEIGLRMALSSKTIDTYRGRMMVKLGVANRSALIRFAIEHDPIAS